MDHALTALLDISSLRANESPARFRIRQATQPQNLCLPRTPVALDPVPCDVERVVPGINDILEDHMRRIAHSLHDEAGQLLAAIHIKLDQMTRALPSDQVGTLEAIKPMLETMETQLRRFSHELRPMVLDELGLGAGIELLRKGVSQRTGMSIYATVNVPGRLPARLESAIYRILQEALENLGATRRVHRANISIEMQGQAVRCSLSYDAALLPASAQDRLESQLRGMRARVEELSGGMRMTTLRGQGAEITLAIPTETHAALAACA